MLKVRGRVEETTSGEMFTAHRFKTGKAGHILYVKVVVLFMFCVAGVSHFPFDVLEDIMCLF